jgi:hypothetical protein
LSFEETKDTGDAQNSNLNSQNSKLKKRLKGADHDTRAFDRPGGKRKIARWGDGGERIAASLRSSQ